METETYVTPYNIDEIVRNHLIECYKMEIEVWGEGAEYKKPLKKVIKYLSNNQKWEEFKKSVSK